MYKAKKILAIITARGGSKGLPEKNIKIINGRPLIAWTIYQAKNSELIDDIFISTDSLEIAKVCDEYGIRIEELRPGYLATDTASSMDVIDYTIEVMKKEGKVFDYILLLEPTSPLRKRNDLDNIIKQAGDNPDCDGVISVGKVHTEHPMVVKKVSEKGNIIPYSENVEAAYQRQLHDEALFPYGVGYLIKTSVFEEKHTIYTSNIMPYYIERWQNYEIDDIYDFRCVETIMKMESDKLWKNI